MKAKIKWPLLLVLILVIGTILAACSSSSKDTSGKASHSPEKEQVLNLTEPQDIPSLNWTQVTDATSVDTIATVKSGLMRLNQHLEPVPDMAASMPKVSKDKKTYTFTLRKDAKWSDGSPVTADDFVYAWQKMNDPKTAAQYGYIFPDANIKNAAKIQDQKDPVFGKVDQLGVKALDEHTLQVTLDKPTPYFLRMMAFFAFLPEKKGYMEKEGSKYGQEVNNLVYNGPYKLVSWKHGDGWTFEKNNRYWNAKNIHVDKVNVKVIKDTSTAVNLYNTGKLDSAEINSDFVNQFKNSDQLHKSLGSTVFFLRLNEKEAPAFKNVNLRKAIDMSIDRNKLAKVLLNNGAIPANYLVPKDFVKGPDGKDFRSAAPNGYLNTDKQEAKKLWKQAQKELGIKTLKLSLMTKDNDLNEKYDEYVANQIEKNLPGINITLNKQPLGSFMKLEKTDGYQMSSNFWAPDYQDPSTFLDLWVSNSPMTNREHFSDPKYDQLIKEIHNLGAEPEKRWKKMQEAEKLLLEKDAAIIPLYQEGRAYLTKPYVKNLSYPAFGYNVDWTHAEVLKH
ncbi:peptide ABC transporter substrate-binding protein [Scopulibacillus cellulosilyticus]|uniref:Peptide ABC transporter substrate-binding protein n=1 Tax=Scopulibacillus cellulosilyticus TaxID=2665665 RepID=A0ABW2PUN3_9BACL